MPTATTSRRRAPFSVFDRIDVGPVAVRGEQLTLARLPLRTPADFEIRWLALYEYDEHGRMAHEIDFDDEDLPVGARRSSTRGTSSVRARRIQRVLTVCATVRVGVVRDDTDALADLVAPTSCSSTATARLRRG